MCYGNIERSEFFYGFHPGRLCGLDAQTRFEEQCEERAWYPHHIRLLDTPSTKDLMFDRISEANTKASVDCTLEEALQGCTADNLRRALQRAGISRRPEMRKAELVALLTNELPKAVKSFRSYAEQLECEGVLLLQRTLQGEVVTHPRHGGTRTIPDAFPFAFVAKSGTDCVSFTPKELQGAFAAVDLTPYIAGKRALESTNRFLHAVTTLCGIMPVETAFAALQNSNESTITREQFDSALLQLTTRRRSSQYLLIESDGVTYVAHHQLQEPSSAGTKFYWQQSYQDSWHEPRWHQPHNEVSQSLRLNGLLEQRRTATLSRIENGFKASDAVDKFIYGLPCIQKLTAYFDAHVPKEGDEYFFADEMVDLLIRLVLIEGQGVKPILSWLTRTGWYLSEGSTSAPVLTKLICDLLKELPRWEYGGWSETEYLDLMGLPCIISETQYLDDALELAS